MKNFIYLLSCVLVLCRCGIDYGDTTGRPLPRLDYSTEDEPSVETDTTIFVSAIIMNDDYDWRRDTAKRTCGCELVLLKDKEKILSLEVSEDNFISPDPDMHHIIDGHLYTDFSTKCETIIKCDGSIILRYPGREYLCGLLLKDGFIYTGTESGLRRVLSKKRRRSHLYEILRNTVRIFFRDVIRLRRRTVHNGQRHMLCIYAEDCRQTPEIYGERCG